MKVFAPGHILRDATSPFLRKQAGLRLSDRDHDSDVSVELDGAPESAIAEMVDLAQKADDPRLVKVLQSILEYRSGRFDAAVPSFNAFHSALVEYLRHDVIDGWIYVVGNDGLLQPELVVGVERQEEARWKRDEDPRVVIKTIVYTAGGRGDRHEMSPEGRSHAFRPGDVSRRKVSKALEAFGIFKETQELRAQYQKSIDRYNEVVRDAYAAQFRCRGRMLSGIGGVYARGRNLEIDGRRVVHNLHTDAMAPLSQQLESELLLSVKGHDGMGNVPIHPVVHVFDLKSHEEYWVHADFMEPYVYDESLREKLILPASHRELLDILTTDIHSFTEDIVEGKSAGNIILCKGVPGVGKTLTAEVYAELTKRPLYRVRSGTLGTSAGQMNKRLEEIFARVTAWDCVLLLDEADVFVSRRGNSLEQNAIVAEFLRAVEYFDGLMFLTSNLGDNIDEAFLNRCAAIIDYKEPDAANARQIWGVMNAQFGAGLDEQVIDDLVEAFPVIRPRDIKMLLRLAMRVAKSRGEALTVDVFRRCAMFRGVRFEGTSAAA